MKKLVIMGALTLALTGCATNEATLSDEFTDTAIFACRTLDGEETQVAVDVGAAMMGHTVTVKMLRALRQAACAKIGAYPAAPAS